MSLAFSPKRDPLHRYIRASLAVAGPDPLEGLACETISELLDAFSLKFQSFFRLFPEISELFNAFL